MKLPNSYYSSWKTKAIGSWERRYYRFNYYVELFKLKPLLEIVGKIKLYAYLIPIIEIRNFKNYYKIFWQMKKGVKEFDNENNEVINRLNKNGYKCKRILKGEEYKVVLLD